MLAQPLRLVAFQRLHAGQPLDQLTIERLARSRSQGESQPAEEGVAQPNMNGIRAERLACRLGQFSRLSALPKPGERVSEDEVGISSGRSHDPWPGGRDPLQRSP